MKEWAEQLSCKLSRYRLWRLGEGMVRGYRSGGEVEQVKTGEFGEVGV